MFSKLLFKTSSKLTFVTIIVVIVVALVSISFFIHENRTKHQLEEIIGYIGEITDIHSTRIYAQKLVMPANDYLITGDKREINNYKKTLPQLKKTLNKLHSFVAALPEDDPYKKKEKEILDTVSKELIVLDMFANKIFNLRPDHPEDGKLMEKMDAKADLIIEELFKYHEIDLEEVNEAFLISHRLSTSAKKTAFFLVLSVIFISALVIYWLHISISLPISKLHAATLNVIEEKYSQVEALPGGDIGVLGETFNIMSNQIQGNIYTLEKINAELSKAKNISETRAQSLSMISNITSTACATLDIDEIIQNLLKNIKYFFNADCAGYFKFNEITGSLSFEICLHYKEKIPVAFKINKDKNIITDSFISKKSLYNNYPANELTGRFKEYITEEEYQSILVSPLVSAGKAIGVLIALSKSLNHFNGSDAELLHTLSNYAASAISNADLHRKFIELEKSKQKQELSVAKNMLTKLLPQKAPEIKDLSVGFISKPAKIIGGDFYDFIKLNDSKMIFSIGDVVGKSVSAALLISMNKYILRTDAYHTKDILQPVNSLNTTMVDETTPEIYTTLIFSKIDTDKKTLSYINCGHPPFIHYKKNENKCYYEQLDESQHPVGIKSGYEFRVKEITYKKGDTFIFFTDGVTEAKDKDRNLFDYDRLLEFVEKNIGLDPQSLAKSIENEVLHYCNKNQEDDIVIIALKC